MSDCPACLSDKSKKLGAKVEFQGTTYKLYACLSCGLCFWDPRTLPDKDLYENDFESSSALMLQRHTIGLHSLSANHDAFFRHNSNGHERRILDVGCGDGIFLEHAMKFGWEVWGIDLDEKSIEVGRRRGLQHLHNQTLEEFSHNASASDRLFDVVTFFEVLEHQSDPMGFLTSLHAYLRKGGVVAGSVPNRNRFTLFTDESGDLPPYHFTRWDCGSLVSALQKAGYVDVKVATVGWGYYLRNLSKPFKVWVRRKVAHNVSAMDLAIRPVEKLEGVSGVTQGQLQRLKLLKTIKTALFRPLELFEELLERGMGRGQMIYFQASWHGDSDVNG